jgi:hypothetical protein
MGAEELNRKKEISKISLKIKKVVVVSKNTL